MAAAAGFFPTLGEPGIVGQFRSPIQNRPVIAAVVLHDHRGLVREGIGRDEVAAANFHRIDPKLSCGFFHYPLHQEGCFRPAGAPFGVHRRRIGKDAVHVTTDRGRSVETRQQRSIHISRDQRREGRQIRAHVGLRIHPQAEKLAVGRARQFHFRDVVPAVGVGEEGFAAFSGPLHRPSHLFPSPGNGDFLRIVRNLRSETAAHVGRNHTQLVLGDAKHEGAHEQADHVRILTGGIQRVAVVGGIEFADSRPGFDGIRALAIVDQFQRGHVIRLGERRIGGLGIADSPRETTVVVQVVNGRRAFRQRRLHGDRRGEFVVVHGDRFGRVPGLLRGFGDDHGDHVAHEAHLALRQYRARRFVHGAAVGGEPAGHSADPLQVIARKHGHDAGHGPGGFAIHGVQVCMSHNGTNEDRVCLAGPNDIVGVIALTGQKTEVFLACYCSTDSSIHTASSSWPGRRPRSALTML